MPLVITDNTQLCLSHRVIWLKYETSRYKRGRAKGKGKNRTKLPFSSFGKFNKEAERSFIIFFFFWAKYQRNRILSSTPLITRHPNRVLRVSHHTETKIKHTAAAFLAKFRTEPLMIKEVTKEIRNTFESSKHHWLPLAINKKLNTFVCDYLMRMAFQSASADAAIDAIACHITTTPVTLQCYTHTHTHSLKTIKNNNDNEMKRAF